VPDPNIVTDVTIYSRSGCHLCDEMEQLVERVANEMPLSVSIVDVSTDPVLEARYGLEVPVLVIDGVKAAKYRIGEADLRRVLAARHRDTSSRSGGTSA
jgi:glutaredoxin